MRLAYLLALLTAGRCWWTWQRFGYTMEPDFSLYTQGGLGLFPSPLGRALGALGAQPFAAASTVAAGAVVVLCALLARRLGGSASLAALLAALIPATLYLGYTGIDPIGLAVLLAAILWHSSLLGVTAALLHLSLAPFALLLLPRSTWPARFALVAFSGLLVACLLLTPYSDIVYGLFNPDALTAAALGGLAFLAIAAPALLLVQANRLVWLAATFGVAECVAQHHLQARYLLPAAFLSCCGRRRDLRSLTASAWRTLHPRKLGDGELTIVPATEAQRSGWSGAPASGENPRPPLTAVLRKSAGSGCARENPRISSSVLPTFGGQRP